MYTFSNHIAKLLSVLLFIASSRALAQSLLMPEIDAKFQTVQCGVPCKNIVHRDWWLMRTNEQVELRDVENNTGSLSTRSEIWKHSADGKLGYIFLMHDDKRAIEYLFDDLRVLSIISDENQWQIISQLISDNELVGLKKTKTKYPNFQGHSVENYRGTIGDAKVNLAWLPELYIPLKLEYVYPKSKVNIRLQQLHERNTLTIYHLPIRTTDEILNSYQQVYFSDVGDMEQSDDAKEWITKAHGAPGLHTHPH